MIRLGNIKDKQHGAWHTERRDNIVRYRQSIKNYMNNYRANRVLGNSIDYVVDTRSECVKGGVSIMSK